MAGKRAKNSGEQGGSLRAELVVLEAALQQAESELRAGGGDVAKLGGTVARLCDTIARVRLAQQRLDAKGNEIAPLRAEISNVLRMLGLGASGESVEGGG